MESTDTRGIEGMLSWRNGVLEAGHTFLHFISGMRTSCREGRRSSLTMTLGILLALRGPRQVYQSFLQILPTWMSSKAWKQVPGMGGTIAIATTCLSYLLPCSDWLLLQGTMSSKTANVDVNQPRYILRSAESEKAQHNLS